MKLIVGLGNVGKEYEQKIGYKADFYVVEIGSGPVRLEE